MLSRQDYNAIAKIARKVYTKEPDKYNSYTSGETYRADYQEGVQALVYEIADYFELTNPRFIRDKFIKESIPENGDN